MTKDLLHTSDFLHSLLDAMPGFIFIVDSDVRISHLNAAAAKLLGASKEMVLLKRGGEALHCIHSTETPGGCGRSAACVDCVVRNSVKKSFQGGTVQRETAKLLLLHAEGTSEIHMMVTASTFRYGDREFCLLVLEDITKLKNAEEELRHHASRLEAANSELEAFNYSVSHDLKTPLRSICGFSTVLLSEHRESLGPEARDCVERIHAAGNRMSQLIDDLLALSQVTKGEMSRETVDLSALAGSVADGLAKSHLHRDIEFAITPGMQATGDGRLIRIVLENLMGNAVKFTASRKQARIVFSVRKQAEGEVYFISDNGAGFDMALAGKLFTPFQRLHDKSLFPGHGIGLATVRRIIHRHGGRVWAEGTVDAGAVFLFML